MNITSLKADVFAAPRNRLLRKCKIIVQLVDPRCSSFFCTVLYSALVLPLRRASDHRCAVALHNDGLMLQFGTSRHWNTVSTLCYTVFYWTEYCYRNVFFWQIPVRPGKTACDITSLTETSEFVHAMSYKSTVAETVEKLSALSDDSFNPSSSSKSSTGIKAGSTVEPVGISVQSVIASLQSNLSQLTESPVSVDGSSSAGKRDVVSTPPKPRQRSVSPVLAVVTTSPVSPTPPPLPTRLSSVSSDKSNSSVGAVTKRFRPPPPIPDETSVSSANPQKNSLSPHLPGTTVKSASPTVRRSVPIMRYI